MKTLKLISLTLMGVFYIGAGLNHFLSTSFYVNIVPSFIPAPLSIVYLSGVAEIALGVLLFIPSYRTWAAFGIIALLIAVFPANLYMYQQGGAVYHRSDALLFWRLPSQAILVLWAYWHTKKG